MIINPKTVNETRFQYDFEKSEQTGDNSIPTSMFLGFTGGGAQIGNNFNRNKKLGIAKLHDDSFGANNQHAIKFGVRLRGNYLTDRSESNYGGTFTFTVLSAAIRESGRLL